MAITRTPIINDDGTCTTGTTWDNSWKTELYDQIDLIAAPAVVINYQQGAIASWDLSLSAAHTLVEWRGTSAADSTITTIAPPAHLGATVTILNFTSYVGFFVHGGGLYNLAKSGPTAIAFGGWIRYQWNGATWDLIGHEQGKPIDIPFASGNFSGFSGLTAGMVTNYSSYLRGSLARYSCCISAATTSGPTTIGVTGFPYNAVSNHVYLATASHAVGGWGAVLAGTNPGAPLISTNRTDFAAFPTAAGAFYLYLAIELPVT